MHINQQTNLTVGAHKKSRLDRNKFLCRLIDILLYIECGVADHASISQISADTVDLVGIKTW
jgi:hypothetical protein